MSRAMSRPSIVIAVLVSALLGALLAVPGVASAAPSAESVIQRILADTNAVRAQAGLPPLARDTRIDAVAGAWSQRQASSSTMSHNPDYARQIPAGWRAAAENVAYGYDPAKVVQAWRDSPGHYRNMTGDFTHIGIGVAWASNGQPYYTQNFARYAGTAPTGNFETLSLDTAKRTFTVKGWAADADSSSPIAVHVYLDGKAARSIRADRSRPDVAAAHPRLGAQRGFESTFAATTGTHRVCLYAINVGPAGANPSIGCRSYTIASPLPFGTLDGVSLSGFREASVHGWAIDPDTADPIKVHVYNNSGGLATTANRARPDVGRAHPAYGADHGYQRKIPLAPGANRVCAYGINVGHGDTNSTLGCRSITVPTGAPTGNLEGVAVDGTQARVSGWALDYDTTAPIAWHAYVNGRLAAYGTASRDRPDVARAHPIYGPSHGFSAAVPIPAGRSTVCVYAINVGAPTGNPALGCRAVTR